MEEFRVYGQVRRVNGELATGVTVSAFDKDLRHENSLGESITDQAGHCEIKYMMEQFRQSEEKNADLIFRLFNSDGISLNISTVIFNDQSLDPSAIIFNAPAEAQIDLVVEPEENGLSEYERYMSELAPVLDEIPIADLTETDVTFLAGETGFDKYLIDLFVTAHRHSALTKVDAVALYGLMRQGLPNELTALLAAEPEMQRDALRRAMAENIIPTYLPDQFDYIITQLKAFRKNDGK